MSNFGIVDLHSNNIHIELGGVTIGKIKIPSDYVPYTFAPILGTHQLLTGDKLLNGLIVVVEDHMFRRNPDVLSPEYPDRKNGFVPSSYDRTSVEEQSRWALVTNLTQEGPLTKFTAIYSDGAMRTRTYNRSIKWAVLNEFEMLPVCDNCGQVHEPQPETVDIETMTRRVTSEFLGQEMSFEDFSDRLAKEPDLIDEILDGVVDKFFQSFFAGDEQPSSENAVEIPADRPQLPGE